MNQALKNFRAGEPSADDIRLVDGLIESGAVEELKPYLVAYLKAAPAPKAEALIQLALKSDDQYLVSETIKCLGYWRYRSEAYKGLVWHGLKWPYDDLDNDVLLASLDRLPNLFEATPEIKEQLRKHLVSENPVLRDAIVEIAQAYMGTPDKRIYRSQGRGDLLDHVDPRVKAWLSKG